VNASLITTKKESSIARNLFQDKKKILFSLFISGFATQKTDRCCQRARHRPSLALFTIWPCGFDVYPVDFTLQTLPEIIGTEKKTASTEQPWQHFICVLLATLR